jgi:serine/threonine-protein kinase
MSAAAPLDHDRIGPYQIIKAIGVGGSARVDLARIARAYGFQRDVVIKRPLEHLRGDARVNDSLRREARLGGRLRHPNIVALLDAGVHDGDHYIVLEYIHGGALRTLMQCEEPARVRDTSLEVALTIVRDVARGLHEAHDLTDETGAALGLVHRDVSPSNVLIGRDGSVKLADFGIAKETRVTTLSGSMHGTVTYMAPEQCRGHAFDRRADVFSLGVILFELVTGHRLFWADNDVASLHRVLEGHIPRARKLAPNIPAALEDIVAKAVAHDPEKRFPTARALADEIDAFAGAAGLLLVNRGVAHWVDDDTSASRAQTVAEAPSASLVDVIAATEPDEPPPRDFGPTDPFDEVATLRERKPRSWLALGAAAALAFGIAGGLAIRRSRAPTPSPPARVAPRIETAPVDDELEMAAPVAESPVDAPAVALPPVRPKRVKRAPAKSEPAAPQVTAPKPKVQWDPTMLLPTDTGSGTKRK